MADSAITQEAFDRLLSWLNPDRERAGKRYESIRRKLIQIFAARGAAFPEEMADECFNVVIRKLPEIIGTYVGEPEFYFVGVARNVYLEWLRKQRPIEPPPASPNPPELEIHLVCLDDCLSHLPDRSREIVIEYYRHDKRAKIAHRAAVAGHLRIAPGALRLRAHRIRQVLEKCVLECAREQARDTV